MFTHHHESSAQVRATPQTFPPTRRSLEAVRPHEQIVVDDGRGSMVTETDELAGRNVGSHIRLSGRVLGLQLHVDEVVTQRNPPFEKTWETVAEPRLLVIGGYRMGFTVTPANNESQLRVFIDYALPPSGLPRWLGRMFGGWYARWCTRRMVDDAVGYYASRGREGASTTGTAM
jgi:hypothetical protein